MHMNQTLFVTIFGWRPLGRSAWELRPIRLGPDLVSQRHYEPLSGGRSRVDWGITALMVAVFLVGLFWFTHGNQFPSYYHPEEEIRAERMIKRDWDLHRPLLSAITTKLLKTAFHVPDDLQTVVRLGRTISAFFAVGSIVCLGLAVYLICNTGGSSVVMLFVALPASILRSGTYNERE